MGGSNRAYDKALIKFAVFAGAADSATVGLDVDAEDGTAIVATDVILGCIEMAASTHAITDRTAASAIIAGGKITVPESDTDKIAVWWLSTDGQRQTASPYIKAEIGAGTTADTDITITGIKVGDEIISAVQVNTATGLWTDETGDTTITADNTVQSTNSTSNGSVFVIWMDRSGGQAYSALNLQFGIATVEASPSPSGDP
ncbi:hypothetical protein LCGC14_2738140, partial [marine sediment metagenome]